MADSKVRRLVGRQKIKWPAEDQLAGRRSSGRQKIKWPPTVLAPDWPWLVGTLLAQAEQGGRAR